MMKFLEIKGKYTCPVCRKEKEVDLTLSCRGTGSYECGETFECGCGVSMELQINFEDNSDF